VEPISGVIIAHNAERDLARALRSLRPWCAELLVVDSGSTDRTRDIAAAEGARVVEHPFRSFLDQKNFAAGAAAHDWVIALDQDEELMGDPRTTLAGVDFADPGRVYSFRRRNWYLGGWVNRTDWRRDVVARLFHRGRARFVGSEVHPSVGGPGCSRHRLDAVIHHRPYRDLAHHLDKINRYTTDLAAEKGSLTGARAGFKLMFDPPWSFFRSYILDGGILLGVRGFVLAAAGAVYTFYKYAKVWERRLPPRD